MTLPVLMTYAMRRTMMHALKYLRKIHSTCDWLIRRVFHCARTRP
eukprot:SAG31_NODE_2896_length_4936_cov_5.275377_5_plen_45_part_00